MKETKPRLVFIKVDSAVCSDLGYKLDWLRDRRSCVLLFVIVLLPIYFRKKKIEFLKRERGKKKKKKERKKERKRKWPKVIERVSFNSNSVVSLISLSTTRYFRYNTIPTIIKTKTKTPPIVPTMMATKSKKKKMKEKKMKMKIVMKSYQEEEKEFHFDYQQLFIFFVCLWMRICLFYIDKLNI